MNAVCQHHSGHEAKIEAAEKAIAGLWKSINEMKTWVILGMGGLLVQVIFFFAGKLWPS